MVSSKSSYNNISYKQKTEGEDLTHVNDDAANDEPLLQRKIALATEGLATKSSELILRDRNRLSKENALTVCNYIIAMKREA